MNMNKYVLEVKEGQSNSAGSKAKQDISYFLNQSGYSPISINIPKNKIIRALFGKRIVRNILKNINSGIFVFQYPMYSRVISQFVLQYLRNYRNIQKIIVIHDVESLRLNKDERNAIKKEISFFNQFDKVISHNTHMTSWLRENGLQPVVTDLKIFDYHNPQEISRSDFDRSVVFAGNIAKSAFLNKLQIQSDLYLMGPGATGIYPKNVHYLGVFDPEEVPIHLTKGFGLVWDGESLDTCDGVFGEYMKYNNPHKVSLYLSSGIPVLIWKKAAMADFIREHNVGLVLNSLNEIDQVLNSITEESYLNMKHNVDQIANDLRTGKYVFNAIQSNVKEK